MCELFGFCSKKSYDLTAWLKEFFSHSDFHCDGWGIATFTYGGVSVEKEPICANDSVYLKNRLSVPIKEPLLLAHIRKASVGSLEYLNTHPFVIRDNNNRVWTLIHNGTIFQSEILEKYKSLQKGSTDSERILYFIVDRINSLEEKLGRRATDRERFETVDCAVADIAPNNKVNLILYDGEQFYVHANMASSLHYKKVPQGVVVSTKPLLNEDWEEVPLSTMFVFREGEEIFHGNDRHHVYVEPDTKKDNKS